ncbi:transposase [Paeniglutamicibacter antarcticus]|uniref:Transposase IS4-like domain-containing protein n=1 Tax=Paeniglutamicibacter antarcticus TaxID=494023 RepID=A0ABP9TQ71_9MICC
MDWLIGTLAKSTAIYIEDVRVVDLKPVKCARKRQTEHRSDLTRWAEHGFRASHNRYFCGLHLHLVCNLQKLPVGSALTGAKTDERLVFLDILAGT